MVVFVNDPKRTVISLSIPRGKAGADRFKKLLEDYGLTFERTEAKKSRTIFHDISGSLSTMSGLLKSMEEIEWDDPEKFYILVSGRKKGVKKNEHGSETRREAGEGREGGDPEGTDPAAGHGEADPVGGDCPADRSAGAEPAEGAEEGSGTLDDCE